MTATTESQDDLVFSRTQLVYATHDYELAGKGFLPLTAGDILYVIEADPSGWWLGVNTRNKKGVFPSTYTVPCGFPKPSEYIEDELQLIRLGERFNVSLVSGTPQRLHASAGFAKETTGSGAGPHTNSLHTIDDLYTQLNRVIIERETAGAQLTASLKELMAAHRRSTAAITPSDAASDTFAKNVSARTNLISTLHADIDTTYASIQTELKKKVRTGILPHITWYRHCGDRLARLDAVYNSPSGALLSDTKLVVADMESRLSTLSSSVKAEEKTYLDAKENLTSRIKRRDDLVMCVLANWAAKAETAKNEYLETKSRLMTEAEATRRETETLKTLSENRSSEFDQVVALLQKQRHKAKQLRASLLNKKELETIDARLQAINKELLGARKRRKKSNA